MAFWTPGTPRGEVHDATACCVEGFSCWIGATILDGRSFRPDTMRDVTVTGRDCEEATRLLREELTRKGHPDAPIVLLDSGANR